ncbi:MAG TPA: cytochrome ubiquinol oxidase subunit I [Prolixibacteraceae bacterium]|nr:cytochrome ubiquinol oxidase subunit I [Prolixibacteraceae bacterium]
MNEIVDLSLIDWSRGQFALTALYHWLFVPLTLGITFILAIMETIYYKTGDPEWKKITRFWMKVFGINFAIGVATGIILEFQFGTNWSYYSWFVGDIFGAPLAIEGIMAFFMESTFIAVMFFGWDKVSKRFHLVSTWLTAIGANLSALWILVANAWMQNPVGMQFNPDTARNEMVNFWDVFLSPLAINKFLHTISSGFVLAGIFIIGISAWFLLKKREVPFAKKSILVAAIFGFISSLFLVTTGDGSARLVAQHQPMKLAAMEGLYEGKNGAGLTALGIFSPTKTDPENDKLHDFIFKIEIPNALSYMIHLDVNAFVPGVKDLLNGNEKEGILATTDKISRGKMAIETLRNYKNALKEGRKDEAFQLKEKFMSKDFQANYFKYFGYGFLTNANDTIPSIPLVFYSFHIMVILGSWFLLFFILSIYFVVNNEIARRRLFLKIAILTIPLVYIAQMAGWTVAEVGRQPWVVQDLLPTVAAVSSISAGSVIVTFWLFALIFTILLIAEVKIMTTQIKIGPKDGGH